MEEIIYVIEPYGTNLGLFHGIKVMDVIKIKGGGRFFGQIISKETESHKFLYFPETLMS